MAPQTQSSPGAKQTFTHSEEAGGWPIEEPCRHIGVISSGLDGDSPDASLPLTQLRTLAALERVFPVRFDQFAANSERLDGLLVLGAQSLPRYGGRVPTLVLPGERGPHNSSASPTRAGGQPRANPEDRRGQETVVLSKHASLAKPLRGRAIADQAPPPGLWSIEDNAATLASLGGRPVWWRVGEGPATKEVSAYPLARLDCGQALREHLRAGRFMGLLPLVSFILRLLGDSGWQLPPLRACFVVDDPNLHWTSYGYLDYAELIEHAKRHGYHMGFATVPLDGWLVKRKAAALLAENSSVLSLAVHGNDHVARELARCSTDAKAEAAIAQGLRRVAALERRCGVHVEHVIVPPHGACSEAVLRAGFRLGAEAACISRPYPWLDGQPAPTPLAGWYPGDLVAGGLPVLPRHPLSASREDLALRALLGHPLIVYGHHVDFADGLDVLAQAAAEIDSLGEVKWGSLGWIARSNYSTRRLGSTLLVKMHSRRIALDVPAGVSALRVLAHEPVGGAAGHRLAHAGGDVGVAFEQGLGISEPLAVVGAGRVELTLKADSPLEPDAVDAPAIRPWPLLRRALVETRDRMVALRP